MSPCSTVHGSQHDNKYVTFEVLMHAAFVVDEIWGFVPEPARMCLRFRGCPVVLDIELSVRARYHKTRVLLRARRLLLLLVAAASGGVRHKFQNYLQ